MTRERLAGDSAAVSSVVAAVLLFALFSTAFLTWTVITLPQWIADNEAVHEGEVVDSFAALQAGLERLSGAASDGTTSATFALAAEPVPLLQGGAPRGSLEAASGFRLQGAFTNPALHLIDGSVSGAPTEPAGGAPLTGVRSFSVLQIALESSVSNNAEAWVELEADDGNDTVTARLTHWGQNRAPTCDSAELGLQIDSPLGSSTHFIACIGDDLPSYTVDLLAATFPFRAGLAQLDTPLTVAVTEGTQGGGGVSADGTYLAVYTDASGFTRLAGSGEPTPGYTIDEAGDRLHFEAGRQEYVQQSLSWEGGALAVLQPDVGAALAMDPSFTVDVSGTVGFLRWTVVDLEATGSLSGGGKATATVTHLGTTSVLLSADAADFTVTSDTAGAWASFFDDQVIALGSSDLNVSAGSGTATLSLEQGTVTEWVIQLRIIHADVRVQ